MRYYLLNTVRKVFNPDLGKPTHMVPAFTNKKKAEKFARKIGGKVVIGLKSTKQMEEKSGRR